MRDPHSRGSGAHRCGRGANGTVLNSADLFMLRFCLDQHADRWRWACSHYRLVCCSTQVGRGQGEGHLWHVPVQYNPFGTGDAWPTAAQLWQHPGEEGRAPVLPQAA